MRALPEYKDLEDSKDVVGLLTKMEELVYNTTNVRYPYMVAQDQLRKIMTMRQDPREGLSDFAKRFLAQVEVTEQWMGPLVPKMQEIELVPERQNTTDDADPDNEDLDAATSIRRCNPY